MKVTIVGSGYVGLVTGACFAEMGIAVCCVDSNEQKINALQRGVIPIYEPGLERLVKENSRIGRLRFSHVLADSLIDCDVCFIAVGTPPGEDGSADLSHVLAVADSIGQYLRDDLVVVDKSTVPVGTAEKVMQVISGQLKRRGVNFNVDVVSNPEFLKEGNAIDDFMRPDRIVVGADTERSRRIMEQLYEPFMRNNPRIVFMSPRDAELTKYAANAMLATKISYMNEIANLCERMQVDVENVRLGIGSDQRIGFSFIYPGCGYGGSCFPKDIDALIHMAESNDFEPQVLQAVRLRNRAQKTRLFEKLTARFGSDLSAYTFAVWGIAFKPGTDDIREAPAIVLIQHMLDAGARVRAYDPVAMENASTAFAPQFMASGQFMLCENQYDALCTVNALLLVTEWKPFRRPDLALMQKQMKDCIIFDGRNQYPPEQMREAGFEYHGIGRR